MHSKQRTEVLQTTTLLILTPQGTYCTVLNLLSHPSFQHLQLERCITLKASDAPRTTLLSPMCFAKQLQA